MNLLQEISTKFEKIINGTSAFDNKDFINKPQGTKDSLLLIYFNNELKHLFSNDWELENLDAFDLVNMFIESIKDKKFFRGDEKKDEDVFKHLISSELLIFLQSISEIRDLGIDIDAPYEISSGKYRVRDNMTISMINELDSLNNIMLNKYIINKSKDNLKGNKNLWKNNGIILTKEERQLIVQMKKLSFRNGLYNCWFKKDIDKNGFYSLMLAKQRNNKTHNSDLTVERIGPSDLREILIEIFHAYPDEKKTLERRKYMTILNKLLMICITVYLFILYKSLMQLDFYKMEKFIKEKIDAKN